MANNTSFLPEDYVEKRIARRTNAICLALFAVVMVSIVAAFFVSGRQHREVRTLQATVNGQFEEAARRLEQLDELRSRKERMIQKARVTSVLIEQVPRSLIMAELINHMPPALSLLELELETKVIRTSPRPTTSMAREAKRSRKNRKKALEQPVIKIQPTKITLNLVGVAPTDVEVAQFMASLSAYELFNEVNLVFSEQSTVQDHEVRKFRIEMSINQEIDLLEVAPTKVARDLKQNPMSNTIEIEGVNELVTPIGDKRRP